MVAEPGRDIARLDADQRTRLRPMAVRAVVAPMEVAPALVALVLADCDRWR
jgi:hypothetical protein